MHVIVNGNNNNETWFWEHNKYDHDYNIKPIITIILIVFNYCFSQWSPFMIRQNNVSDSLVIFWQILVLHKKASFRNIPEVNPTRGVGPWDIPIGG